MTLQKLSGHPIDVPQRRATRQILVGTVAVGGAAPVSVQTMTKTDTRDVAATVAQIRSVKMLGCDIVRVAVPDTEAARALALIRKEVDIPLVADIHFDHRLAVMAIDAGVDGLRINPGNIGGRERVREVVKAAEGRRIPIRIGVNSGSLERDLLEKYGHPTAQALVESALRHVTVLEEIGYREIKISVKAPDVRRTVAAYRLLAEKTSYPLHLGVTEAGTLIPGTVRSCVAMGILLAEGIGDTIRVSLTDSPEREVLVGLELLRALGLRPPGTSVVACPTCGRIEVDVISLAADVERRLNDLYLLEPAGPRPLVAVMGCTVNGPGEAREADVALVGGKGKFALYVQGAFKRTLSEEQALDELLQEIRIWRKQQPSKSGRSEA